jgi:hypothetical protein
MTAAVRQQTYSYRTGTFTPVEWQILHLQNSLYLQLQNSKSHSHRKVAFMSVKHKPLQLQNNCLYSCRTFTAAEKQHLQLCNSNSNEEQWLIQLYNSNVYSHITVPLHLQSINCTATEAWLLRSV